MLIGNYSGGYNYTSGPDSFNFNFIMHIWKIIAEDIKNALFNFYESGYIPRGCNGSFISFIPKC